MPQDFGQAAQWIRKAANQGLADAQKFLGILYVNGQGVPQDYAEAAKWYRKAADQGNASAQYSLGFMYNRGLGVPRDPVQAELWRRKAAEQGYELAQPAASLDENVAKTIIAGIAVGVTVMIIKNVLGGGSSVEVHKREGGEWCDSPESIGDRKCGFRGDDGTWIRTPQL